MRSRAARALGSAIHKTGDAVNILVVNCGSSSIKYSLFRMNGSESEEVLASGLVEKIGEAASRLKHETDAGDEVAPGPGPRPPGRLRPDDPGAAGGPGGRHRRPARHPGRRAPGRPRGRAVHARAPASTTTSCAAIEACVPLAPLHNPPNLTGIRAAMALMPDVPHVAVFDTAFHETLPRHAFLYAIPYDLYAEHRIRRYGFHGTSHRYVTEVAAKVLGKPLAETNVITCHLGNGCSVTAVAGGKSVDTSMGLTPLEGLVMGTRCGDIDPALVFHLVRTLGLSVDEVDSLLNRRSGLAGLSGVSNDMREVVGAAAGGQRAGRPGHRHLLLPPAQVHRRVHGGPGAGGRRGLYGRHRRELRPTSGSGRAEGLEPLGYVMDAGPERGPRRGPRDVAADGSPKRILVIPTDEEAMIARDTAAIAAGH